MTQAIALPATLDATLDATLAALPRRYPGPGGACAVLRDGEIIVRHAWGWANAERRIAFTPRTLFRMCSITKQFTCGTLLTAFPDPSVLDADVAAHLPHLEQRAPRMLHLCHNQSGLRDYWAVAMLHGSPPEAPFGDGDAARIVAATRSLQFVPGTRYSYCNQNFRLISEILEHRTGENFADLLRTKIFDPIGMETAFLAADTRAMPDGTVGYEGDATTGFREAENRILWTGDAGLGASLDDMIAWERHIDATRDDPTALYSRLTAPTQFADGAPAAYGFGVNRRPARDRAASGHGGALRGWRSHRIYLPRERVSVVVMFNHLADAHEAALDLLAAALGEARKPDPAPRLPAWRGAYLDLETSLAVRIDADAAGQLRLRFGQSAERLDLIDDATAHGETTTLRHDADGLHMRRPFENQATTLHPCGTARAADFAGAYRCAELETALTIEDAGGTLYGAFAGHLGTGRMELLEPIGDDVWALPCPRALDHTPPGDWTLRVRRDAAGAARAITVGCWLARGLEYVRAG